MKTRAEQHSRKAAQERAKAKAWLLPYLVGPKNITKEELRVAAMRELSVSKSSFNFAWISAIEQTGRHDWYEPLRGKPKRN